jgi:hypothetical protein
VFILGNVHSLGRLRVIPLGLHARHQVSNILIQLFSIFLPTYTIYATGSVPAEPLVALFEKSFIQ